MMSMEVIFTVKRKGYWERSERNEKDGANVCPTICNSKDLPRPSTARPHFRHISQSVPKAPSNSSNLSGLSAMDLEINGVHAVAEAVHGVCTLLDRRVHPPSEQPVGLDRGLEHCF